MNGNHNQICVTDIYAKGDDNSHYEFLATVNNFSILREFIAIGESVTSNDFTMIFPDTIGQSKWKLTFYPRGQYVDGQAGSGIGIYLVMLSCEQLDNIFKANVSFQLQSKNEGENADHGPIKIVNAEFKYSNPNSRWVGEPNFVAKNFFTAKRRARFCKDDTLIIRCSIQEKNECLSNDNNVNGDDDNQRIISPDDFQDNNDIDWCKDTLEQDGKEEQPENQSFVENNNSDWCTVACKKGNANASKPKSSRNERTTPIGVEVGKKRIRTKIFDYFKPCCR